MNETWAERCVVSDASSVFDSADTQFILSRKTMERIKDALTLGSKVRPDDFAASLRASGACTVALVALEMLATEVES